MAVRLIYVLMVRVFGWLVSAGSVGGREGRRDPGVASGGRGVTPTGHPTHVDVVGSGGVRCAESGVAAGTAPFAAGDARDAADLASPADREALDVPELTPDTSILDLAAIAFSRLEIFRRNSFEDHAVAVSHHNATLINGELPHDAPGRNYPLQAATGEPCLDLSVLERLKVRELLLSQPRHPDAT